MLNKEEFRKEMVKAHKKQLQIIDKHKGKELSARLIEKIAKIPHDYTWALYQERFAKLKENQ